MVLAGNKCDLEDQRMVSKEDGQSLAARWGGIPFFETSAKLGLNVNEAFLEIACQVIKANPDKVGRQNTAAEGITSWSLGLFSRPA